MDNLEQRSGSYDHELDGDNDEMQGSSDRVEQ